MLDVADLSKRYGETLALEGASIAFAPGSVHTILGENGSGKSTLVKLLSGIVAPDRGEIRLDGRPFRARDPRGFIAGGFATVFQEVLVAPDRSVVENVLLGLDSPASWAVRPRRRRALVSETLARFATTEIPLDAPAGEIPLAAQQLVVLARALVRRPRILILDEVTAALDFADREAVFAAIEEHARGGALVLFISHRMDEVMRLSRTVSVLRGGRVVATQPIGACTPETLLSLMAPAAHAREPGHG